MSITYKKYIHDFTKALEMKKNTKKRIIRDICYDIEARLSNGEKFDDVFNSLGSPKELAKEFNRNYPEYRKTKVLCRVRLVAIVGLIVSFFFAVIGFVGRFLILNGSNVSHTGGVDLPTKVFTSSAPVSMLSIFDCVIKISIIVAIVAILTMGYFIVKSKKKG